jgi:hypothetical protein
MREFILNLDRPRRLKFGFKAIRLIREKFGGREISDLMNMKVDEMSTIAWAGLIHEDEGLTAEKVEALLDEKIGKDYSVMDVIGILVAAIAEQVGVGKKTIETKSEEQEKPPSESESPTPSLKT